MKRALFICNTSYQILFTLNFISEKPDYKVGVIITDTLPNIAKVKANLQSLNCFLEVSTLCLKDFPKLRNYQKVIHYYLQRYFDINFTKKLLYINYTYDELYFANFNEEIAYIYRLLLRKNKELSINMFEDGFATYSLFYYETLHELLKPSRSLYRGIRKRIYDNFYAVKKMLVFNPEYMLWKSDCFEIEKTSFHDTKDNDFINLICRAFEVDMTSDLIEQRYIFFEESYSADNKEINDLELVNRIADVVGKNNLYIKTHPRNTISKFANEGYITNKKTSTPWEVLCLINSLEEKVLITIASVSVLTPRVLLGMKYKGFMLYKCAYPQESLRQDIIPTYERVRKSISEDVLAPDSIEDLIINIKEEETLT